jgi:hypothetical protein
LTVFIWNFYYRNGRNIFRREEEGGGGGRGGGMTTRKRAVENPTPRFTMRYRRIYNTFSW